MRARQRVSGVGSGQHRATGHGSSMDFDDYRPYQPGDDPRRVDHHAYLRLGRLLVKLVEAEDDAGVQIVIDTSASMRFGAKAAVACRLAAAVAMVALQGGDRVRITTAGPTVKMGPWLRGRPAVHPMLDRLADIRDVDPDRYQPTDTGVLVDAITRCLPASRRGPVVVLGDLLTHDHERVLRTLGAARSGSTLLHVVGRQDIDPWLDDDPRLVDADDGSEIDGAATPAARQRFEERRDRWLDAVPAAAGAAGVAYYRIVDDIEAQDLLLALPRSGVVA